MNYSKINLIAIFIISIFFITPSLFSMQPTYMWKGRAVPLAYNTATGDWSVLLRINPQSGFWEDFYENSLPGERGNIVAARALARQTNSMYSNPINHVPWQKTPTGDIVHFVPVKFLSGSNLYQKARNCKSSNFSWIPTKEILMSSGDIARNHERKLININRGVLKMLRAYLPQALAQLSPKPSSIAMSQPSTVTSTTSPLVKPSTATASSKDSWSGISGAIYFYNKNQPYYEFTNFYEAPLRMADGIWPTSEHYYQAQKFVGTPLYKQIQSAPSAREAFTIARTHKSQVCANWQSINLQVMLKALRTKFTQHTHLTKLLLNTGNKLLVENAGTNDSFFGAGADGKGSNYLGQLLMHVRNELRAQKELPFTPYATAPEYFAAHP